MELELTNKDRMLLQNQLAKENICWQQYLNYASLAIDPELKRKFKLLAEKEEEHYNTLNQILTGEKSNKNSDSLNQQRTQASNNSLERSLSSQFDQTLSYNMLLTEKFISNIYDSSIFECSSPLLRETFQKIQKEEQQHGEKLLDYLYEKKSECSQFYQNA